jgi:alcohol dehydrogenase
VIAVGRNAAALDTLANAGRGRVTPVAATGDSAADVERIRAASHGGADMAFDMVRGARPEHDACGPTQPRPGGRLVLMGSMAVPVSLPYTEVMLNSGEILGQFMYPRVAYRRLLALIGTGELDMSVIRPVTFALPALPDAIERAAAATNFKCVVIEHKQ